MSRRTLDDLSDEEYEDYEKNPENYQDVTDATNEDIASMMGDYDDDEVNSLTSRSILRSLSHDHLA